MTLRDISKTIAAQRELAQLASHDQHTGLANRHWLNKFLPGVIARARHDQAGFVIMFIDVDAFKEVNDSHGHSAGDQLLQLDAQRL